AQRLWRLAQRLWRLWLRLWRLRLRRRWGLLLVVGWLLADLLALCSQAEGRLIVRAGFGGIRRFRATRVEPASAIFKVRKTAARGANVFGQQRQTLNDRLILRWINGALNDGRAPICCGIASCA
ncbi:MAG: hypothetical protein WA465_04590, partial [Methylovirgula sp.]